MLGSGQKKPKRHNLCRLSQSDYSLLLRRRSSNLTIILSAYDMRSPLLLLAAGSAAAVLLSQQVDAGVECYPTASGRRDDDIDLDLSYSCANQCSTLNGELLGPSTWSDDPASPYEIGVVYFGDPG